MRNQQKKRVHHQQVVCQAQNGIASCLQIVVNNSAAR
uniref:Uncharacterized protein n=1 Tax=Arundo donax TaxID=35708 RepID=A0A0A9EAN1_ARUDO